MNKRIIAAILIGIGIVFIPYYTGKWIDPLFPLGAPAQGAVIIWIVGVIWILMATVLILLGRVISVSIMDYIEGR